MFSTLLYVIFGLYTYTKNKIKCAQLTVLCWPEYYVGEASHLHENFIVEGCKINQECPL